MVCSTAGPRDRSRRSGPCSTAAVRGRAVLGQAGIGRTLARRAASVVAATTPTLQAARAARPLGLPHRGSGARDRTFVAAAVSGRRANSANMRPARRSTAARRASTSTTRRVERARLAVHRHDEVIARARAGDVEEPQLLVEVHLLVDRAGAARTPRSGCPSQPISQPPVGVGNSTCTPPRRRRPRGHARHDRDRELEALGAVDGEDPHRVVVGLGQHGLDDPRALGGLARAHARNSRRRARRRPRSRRAPGRRRTGCAARCRAGGRRRTRARARAGPRRCARAARSAPATSARRAAPRGTHRLARPGGRPADRRAADAGESQRPPCSTWKVKRSSSPQPNSGERSAATSASSSVGSSIACSTTSRSRTSRLRVDERLRVSARYGMAAASSASSS